jgi:glycosyltransferase involved in cell wall biosynthesis
MDAQVGTRRLLAINNYFYRRGGAETIFLEHIKLFSGDGWETVPFSMHHPNNLASPWSSYFVPEIEYGRQQGALTKIKHAAEVIYSRAAQRNIKALIEKTRPAVAHAHNIYHHLSPAIFSTLRAEGIPVVMTTHDLKLACPAYKMLSHGRVCEKCRGGHIYNVVANRCVKESLAVSSVVFAETLVHRMLGLYRNNVDRFVVPSRFYREKLIEWGWPGDKLIYIPNFVDVADLRTDWQEGDYFLFAGRLAPEKGLETLIRASAISGQKVVIAGTGPDEIALKALAEASGANVRFAGFVTGNDLFQLIGQSKALVLPSEWYENAPVSILEAYGLGRPVIGARIGGIPEMIVEGETGRTANSGDPSDLARVMTAMAALPDAARKAMGMAGRAWVVEEFSSSAYRDRIKALYEKLM